MNEYYRGAVVCVIGNALISLGLNIKEYAKRQRKTALIHSHSHRSTQLFIAAVVGPLFVAIGNIANIYAMAFAPQTLLSALGSVQFIVALLCSAILFRNQVRWSNILGTLAVVAGCATIVFGFCPKNNQKFTLMKLYFNFSKSPTYLKYLFLVIIAAIVNISSDSLFVGQGRSRSTSLKSNNERRLRAVGAFVFSASAAMVGSQSVVAGKSLVIITRQYLNGQVEWTIFHGSVFLFLLIIWMIAVVFWVTRHVGSVAKFDPALIIPMNQVMWITFSVISSGLYFKEFEHATLSQWTFLIAGLSLTFAGLFLLVPEDIPRGSLLNTEPYKNYDEDFDEIAIAKKKAQMKAKKFDSNSEASQSFIMVRMSAMSLWISSHGPSILSLKNSFVSFVLRRSPYSSSPPPDRLCDMDECSDTSSNSDHDTNVNDSGVLNHRATSVVLRDCKNKNTRISQPKETEANESNRLEEEVHLTPVPSVTSEVSDEQSKPEWIGRQPPNSSVIKIRGVGEEEQESSQDENISFWHDPAGGAMRSVLTLLRVGRKGE